MSQPLHIVCPECGGDQAVCLACKNGITDCECGPDSEPCTCGLCDGQGSIDADEDAPK